MAPPQGRPPNSPLHPRHGYGDQHDRTGESRLPIRAQRYKGHTDTDLTVGTTRNSPFLATLEDGIRTLIADSPREMRHLAQEFTVPISVHPTQARRYDGTTVIEKNDTQTGNLRSPDEIEGSIFPLNEKPQAEANVPPVSEFSLPAVTTEGDQRPSERKLTLSGANQTPLQLDATRGKSNITENLCAIESLLLQMNTSV